MITAYALADVPIPVIAKLLAGHSRLITTLYYVKLTPSVMAKKMEDAHDYLNETEKSSLQAFLRDVSVDQIELQAACVDQGSVKTALQNRTPAGWGSKHIGVCLMARNTSDQVPSIGGCHNGGSIISKTIGKPIYGEVPHHPENCVRCRWFVTDASYLLQLVSHLNFLSYKASEAAESAVSLEAKIVDINEKRCIAETAGKPFTDREELDTLQRRFESQTSEANAYTEDWVACLTLINRTIDIEMKRNNEDKTNKIIAAGNEKDLRIGVTETNSKLLQMSLICEDAELYPDLLDKVKETDIITERTISICKYMRQMGREPFPIFMDKDTQLISINAILRKMAFMSDKDNHFNGRAYA